MIFAFRCIHLAAINLLNLLIRGKGLVCSSAESLGSSKEYLFSHYNVDVTVYL